MVRTLCALLFVSLLFSQIRGMPLLGREKRGWTLNSAGYLLGPYAHRTLTVRHGGTVGKRNTWTENSIKPSYQTPHRSLAEESYLQTLLDLLTYLHLKEGSLGEEVGDSLFHEDVDH